MDGEAMKQEGYDEMEKLKQGIFLYEEGSQTAWISFIDKNSSNMRAYQIHEDFQNSVSNIGPKPVDQARIGKE